MVGRSPEERGNEGDPLEVVVIICPWCWEKLEVQVPIDSLGVMVEDCEVCCRPWQLEVVPSTEGELGRSVTVMRAY